MSAARRSDYTLALGRRLRAVRKEQRLSLAQVEEKSGGRWKASVVASYERGQRGVSAERAMELAEFYGTAAGLLVTGHHDVAEDVIAAAVAKAIAADRARACALITEGQPS